MSDLRGSLTPMQHEILDVVWASQSDGITTSEIWQEIGKRRELARTTILNQVDRLEKRGWLKREKTAGSFRYFATVSREETEQQLADQFVDHFFSGSASRLVASLFGGKRISESEVQELRQLLDEIPQDDGEHANEGGRS